MVGNRIRSGAGGGGRASRKSRRHHRHDYQCGFSSQGGEPVKAGFVASLNRSGANLTGVGLFAFSLAQSGLRQLNKIKLLVWPTILTALVGRKSLFAALANPQLLIPRGLPFQ
jgi:hypothetical protein